MGFKKNEVFESKECSIIKQVKKVFIKQKIIHQYRVEKYFIDLYFPENILGIEIDENGNIDRSEVKEKKEKK